MSNIKFKLVLCTWNNYLSRKVRNIRQEAGEDYLSVMNYFQTNQIEFQAFTDINFKYNDGVATKQIIIDYINSSYDISKANYLLVFDEGSYLAHCWFIMESTYESGSKYILTLKRDLVVDYYGKIKTLPMFVQKGLLQDDDPMIFNKEGMSFNQIKVGQTLLKENNQSTPWIVGYIDGGRQNEEEFGVSPYAMDYLDIDGFNIHLNDSYDLTLGGSIFVLKEPIQLAAQFEKMVGPFDHNRYSLKSAFDFINNANSYDFIDSSISSTYQGIGGFRCFTLLRTSDTFDGSELTQKYKQKTLAYMSSIKQGLNSFFSSEENSPISLEDFATLMNLSGKIVYSSSRNKYFRIVEFNNAGYKTKNIAITSNGNTSSLYAVMRAIGTSICSDNGWIYEEDSNPYRVFEKFTEYVIGFEEVTVKGALKTHISNTRNSLEDAPMDMFCLPLSTSNLQLIQKLVKRDKDYIYDVQIVPYCPARFMMIDGVIDRTGMVENVDYTPILESDGNDGWVDVGEIIYCRSSSDTINIEYNYPVIDKKIENETVTMRLVASNHGSSFEFSPAKNEGVNGFIVTYSYKPYTPYIHVKPVFKGLYGSTFQGDSRGITFVGDFSIDMISDKWAQFQIENKNYQATFNNEIQTMDKLNQITLGESIVGSQLNAAASGVAVGGMTGNAYAGIAAGVASSVGGIADVSLGQERYRINKQLKISQFEYQLGNIKALPKTISKVTAYCIDNLYFPYVEVYDATDVEKQALRDKINYDGMTVMRVGTLEEFSAGRTDYELNFFKAELITLPYDLEGDFHEINELALMLEKGIYL